MVDGQQFAVHIGEKVIVAHGAQVHGPVLIGDRVHIGLNAIVFDAKVGEGVLVAVEDGQAYPLRAVPFVHEGYRRLAGAQSPAPLEHATKPRELVSERYRLAEPQQLQLVLWS